jgi:hypothetical protein
MRLYCLNFQNKHNPINSLNSFISTNTQIYLKILTYDTIRVNVQAICNYTILSCKLHAMNADTILFPHVV